MSDQTQVPAHIIKCDHICLLPADHVEQGMRHFYGYELPSPREATSRKGRPVCDFSHRERNMVICRPDTDGEPGVWCDPCLADIVQALNEAGLRTVASCCGHFKRPGSVVLADGRELMVRPFVSYGKSRTEHSGAAPMTRRLVDLLRGDGWDLTPLIRKWRR